MAKDSIIKIMILVSRGVMFYSTCLTSVIVPDISLEFCTA